MNANAFYELGIRHASAKPTIHVASTGTKLPFDNSGYLAIFFDKTDWQSIASARDQLRKQYELALTPGFKTSNPVIQALSVKAFNASPNSTEKAIGDLMTRIEKIERNTEYSQLNKYKYDIREKSLEEKSNHIAQRIQSIEFFHGYEKYDITDQKIHNYARDMTNISNYNKILNMLSGPDFDLILKEVGEYIPF